jgi:hypothetical protein
MTSTDLATVTTSPVNITAWSAEDGELSGTMLGQRDDTAWNGGCVSSVSDGDGMAFYAVPVTVASDYRLWCRARLPSGTVSLGVSINDTPEQMVELAPSGVPGGWQWVPISAPWLRLESAVQTITLRAVGADVSIDEMVLSNDPRWTPDVVEHAQMAPEELRDP